MKDSLMGVRGKKKSNSHSHSIFIFPLTQHEMSKVYNKTKNFKAPKTFLCCDVIYGSIHTFSVVLMTACVRLTSEREVI